MRICFISYINMNRGSYRVHINNVNQSLNKIKKEKNVNVDSEIISIDYIDRINLLKYNVIIIDKALIIPRIVNLLKKKLDIKNHKYLLGCITPNKENNTLYKLFNFCIVGSVIEKDSLLKYFSNIYIIPQIELMFENPKKFKIHKKKNTITIGYHGNPNHLNHLNFSCKNAINKLSKKNPNINFRFLAIMKNNNEWIVGKPNIPIEFREYNLKTIERDLLEIDIGIVPNISGIQLNQKLFKYDLPFGRYESDIIIRFKNKSNIGRLLVFNQLKIPVISDYTPSNMYILDNPDNGYAVCSEEGWYNAFNELLDEKHREFIAENAYHEMKKKYNLDDYTNRLVNDLNKLLKYIF